VAGLSLALSTFTKEPPVAAAAPNHQVNYQGKLTDSSNVAVPDGTYHMRFWLLASPTAATTTALWSEDRSAAAGDRVTVRNGLFSAMLGSSTPLTSVDFNQTLYLGVEVGGAGGLPAWDGEMSPRKVLGTVPAAFEAGRLDGLTSSHFLRSDTSTSLSSTSASTLLTITQSGAGDILNIFDGTNEVFSIRDGGIVGIGSSSPSSNFTLSVSGSGYFGGSLTATGTLIVQGSGTSTFANGVDITSGCYAVAGVCLSSTPTNLFATTSLDTSAKLAAILGDETGSGALVFGTNAILASSTLTGLTTLQNATSATLAVIGTSYFGGNVGIGTTNPVTKLQVGVLVNDGAGYTYDSDSLMVTHQTPTATAVLNDPKTVLTLARQGTSGQAYGAAAMFNISRFENSSVNSRTRLDISLANGAYAADSNNVMTLLSSGNVGIGTTSPEAGLSISAADAYGLLHLSNTSANGTASISFRSADDANGGAGQWLIGKNLGGLTSDQFSIWQGTAGNRLTIDATGLVGIGTTTPLAQLSIYSTASGGVLPGSGTTPTGSLLSLQNNASGNSIYMGTDTSSPYSGWIQVANSANLGATFPLLLNPNGGNVGIGTSTPAQLLDIEGNAYVRGVVASIPWSGDGIVAAQAGSASDRVRYQATIPSSGTWYWGADGSDTSKYKLAWNSSTFASPAMVVTTAGLVGIGTTTPDSLLTLGGLSGGAATNKGIIQIASGADINAAASGLEFKGSSFQNGFGWKIASPDRSNSNVPLSFAYRSNSATWTELLTMRSDTGTIGIGTTTPGGTLDVTRSANDSGTIMRLGNNVSGTAIYYDFVRSASTGALSIQGSQTGFNNILLAPTSGNVGIGTTTPLASLSIYGGSASAGAINIGGSLFPSYNGIWLNGDVSTGNYNFLSSAAEKGLYINRPTANAIRFRENNNDQMVIASGGNVGIGTTSPFAKLSIHQNASDTGTTLFAIASSTVSATTTLFAVRNSGNIGIGTESPGSLLHVSGTGEIATFGAATHADHYVLFRDDTTNGLMVGYSDATISDTSGTGLIRTGSKAFAVSTGDTSAFDSVSTADFVITSAGNVGIGTTSPAQTLSVVGNGYFTSGIGIGGAGSSVLGLNLVGTNMTAISQTYTSNPANYQTLRLMATGVTGTSTLGFKYSWRNDDTSIRADALIFSPDGQVRLGMNGTAATTSLSKTDEAGTGLWFPTSATMAFSTGATERLRITSAGYVGIGTTSPFAKLSIHQNTSDTGTTLFAIASSTASATSTLFSVMNSGNVGIGTASPVGLLNLRGYTGGTGASALASHQKNLVIGGAFNQPYNSGSANLLYIGDYSNDPGEDVYPIYVEDENNIVDFFLNAGVTGTALGKRAYFGGKVGVGTTSPYANFSVHAPAGNTNTTLFAIASSTASATTTLFSVSNTGAVSMAGGNASLSAAGALTVASCTGCGGGGSSDPFPSAATSTRLTFSGGLLSTASTTVGGGTRQTGLTINGGATTTGDAYFASAVGIGTTSPMGTLAVNGNVYSTGFALTNNMSTFSGDQGGAIELHSSTAVATPYFDWARTTNDFDFRQSFSPTSNVLYFQSSTTGAIFQMYGNGRVGVGNAPSALFSIGTTTAFSNIAASNLFTVHGGALGTTLGSEKNLGSFGFTSGNEISLGVHAYRTANGSDWTTAALGLSIEVDSTTRAGGASLWLHPNGNIGIGTTTPGGTLTVENGTVETGTSPAFLVGGSLGPQLAVTSFGNVGIGTSTARYPLEIVGGSASLALSHPSLSHGITDFTFKDTFFFVSEDSPGAGGADIRGFSGDGSITPMSLGGFSGGNPTVPVILINAGKKSGTSVAALASTETVLSVSNLWSPLLTILGGGNVGVGTTSSTAKFSIHANNGETNTTLFAIGSSTASATTTLFQVRRTGTAFFSGSLGAESGSDEYLCIDPTTFEITRGGANCAASSARYKDDIQDLAYGLDAVMRMRPASFKWNELSGQIDHDSLNVGFIAEEMFGVVPEVVEVRDGLPESIDYDKLTAVLASATQELNRNVLALSGDLSSSTPEAESFAEAFFENLFARVTAWLADTQNGIGELFADEVHTNTVKTDTLCVGDTCVTEAELQALIQNADEGGGGASPEPQPKPAPEPPSDASVGEEPVPEPEPELPVEQVPEALTGEEPEPLPPAKPSPAEVPAPEPVTEPAE